MDGERCGVGATPEWLRLFSGVEPCALESGFRKNSVVGLRTEDGFDGIAVLEAVLKGEAKESPRDAIYYFGQGGELNAVRWDDWKISFAQIKGNIAVGERVVTNWPMITHLRADPYEVAWEEGEMGYLRWYADNMWLFVPVQAKLKEFFMTIPDYPFQEGSSLSAGGINYNSLKAMKAMNMLKELDERFPVGR